MECINEVFPVILYFLLAILIVVFIILGIKLIRTLNKVDKVVEDVNYKASKLNGVFNIIDNTTDALSSVTDHLINFVSNRIINLVNRKNKKRKEESDYE